jgi:hypothetical protein
LKELRTLYRQHPDLWEELRKMDSRVEYKFRPDYSVEQLEARFKREIENEARTISLFEEGAVHELHGENC